MVRDNPYLQIPPLPGSRAADAKKLNELEIKLHALSLEYSAIATASVECAAVCEALMKVISNRIVVEVKDAGPIPHPGENPGDSRRSN